VPLLLALAGRHVDGWPPKDEEHVFHGGEAACVAIASVFLGLCLVLTLSLCPDRPPWICIS
jgi:hypothetical protein